jgi:hypothetical protein
LDGRKEEEKSGPAKPLERHISQRASIILIHKSETILLYCVFRENRVPIVAMAMIDDVVIELPYPHDAYIRV